MGLPRLRQSSMRPPVKPSHPLQLRARRTNEFLNLESDCSDVIAVRLCSTKCRHAYHNVKIFNNSIDRLINEATALMSPCKAFNATNHRHCQPRIRDLKLRLALQSHK